MSAAILQDPKKKHNAEDDQESAYHLIVNAASKVLARVQGLPFSLGMRDVDERKRARKRGYWYYTAGEFFIH